MTASKASTQKQPKTSKKGILDDFNLFYEKIPAEEDMKLLGSNRLRRQSK